MAIDRRQVVLAGAAAALASLTGSIVARARAVEQTRIISQTAIPVREAENPLSFDLFYDLSRYITVRSELDRDVARRHFQHFRLEEWGWLIAGRIYATIHEELASGLSSAPELLTSGKLSDLDQWYAEHILDAWYEGVYRYDGSEVRVTYEDALIWDVVEELVPVQGLSDAEYGYWGERPSPGDAE